VSDLPCDPACLVVTRLVTDLARATGRSEPTVRLSYGLNGTALTAALLDSARDRKVASNQPCRCLATPFHEVEQDSG
jgi:hypothetical protein